MESRRQIFGDVVGMAAFDFQPVGGNKVRVCLCVGTPYQVSDAEWACPVEIRGFEPRYADARGGNSMQALCLAIFLLRSRVESFVAKGGQVLNIDDGSVWHDRGLGAIFGNYQ